MKMEKDKKKRWEVTVDVTLHCLVFEYQAQCCLKDKWTYAGERIFFGGVANRPFTETIEQNYADGFLKDF